MKTHQKKTRILAFTVIELLVVIVIIGILSAISVAGFNNFQEKAAIAALQSVIYEDCVNTVAECVAAEGDCKTFEYCNGQNQQVGAVEVNGLWVSNTSMNSGTFVKESL